MNHDCRAMEMNSSSRAICLALTVAVSVAITLSVLLGMAGAKPTAASGKGIGQGWETVYSETFEIGIGSGWLATDASDLDDGDYRWGATAFTPTSPITAAWCVGAGADGISLTAGLDHYPDHVDVWLLSDPLELRDAWDAEARFSWWLETAPAVQNRGRPVQLQTIRHVSSAPEEGDWLGWCILTDPTDLEGGGCTYVSGDTGGWMKATIPLEDYLPVTRSITTTLWIAFRFVSDGDDAAGRGAFVDDVELRLDRGYHIWLPLAPKNLGTPAQPQHPLRNGGFEEDWGTEGSHRVLVIPDAGGPYETEVGNIFTPPGWLTWFYHDPGTWDQPEVRDARASSDPRRVHSGDQAMLLFTFNRRHDAGFLQQVEVQAGAQLSLTAWAHAWSNHPIEGHEDCTDKPDCSAGVGSGAAFLQEEDVPPLNGDPWNDAIGNFSFMLGIDPTGGTDPYAPDVVWGQVAHIYNEHRQVREVVATAESDRVTVFLRTRTLWAFKHNDAYWDDVELVAVGGGSSNDDEIPWTYPVIDRGSKVGVHSILPNGVGGFAQELADAGTRFPVVKAVDDLGWLPGVKETSPDSILVARLKVPNEGCSGVENPSFNMEAHARGSLDVILAKIAADPRLGDVVDYWEVYNEPDPPGPDGYRRLSELMIETMDLAEEDGLKIAIFSLNAGTPEWDEMQAMVATGVFSRARRGGHILALHEGTFATHDPQDGWGSTIPGSPQVPGAGALNFRYRYLYHLLEERGEAIPLVVSEWYCGDEQSASTQTLVDAVSWYDGEASQDYYFWATCPFTLGPTSSWRHTDYERVYDGGLVDHMIQVKDRENAPVPPLPGDRGLPSRLRMR